MSERIGETVPAPLRFELGQAPIAGETARAVLLVTVCKDASPRVAVLATAEVQVVDHNRLRLNVRAASSAAANLARNSKALLWYVLDAAAYSVCGTCSAPPTVPIDPDYATFELIVRDVYRDFEPSAPMMAPPTYRTPQS